MNAKSTARTPPRFRLKEYFLEWCMHVVFVPIGIVVAVKDGVCDWFKYRPKRSDYYE